MKRVLILAFAAVLVTAGTVSAQTPAPKAPATPQATPATQTAVGPNFVDADGDGICDLRQARAAQGATARGGRAGRGGYGPGNGTGHQGIGPRDGTGFGAVAGAGTGTGVCDGTGPKGRGRRGGRG
jgi:hypothetical protein